MWRKCIAVGTMISAIGLAGMVHAQNSPRNQWGQEVKECNASDCYAGGTKRGAYVSRQARDEERPGYAQEIHDLANPGASDPKKK